MWPGKRVTCVHSSVPHVSNATHSGGEGQQGDADHLGPGLLRAKRLYGGVGPRLRRFSRARQRAHLMKAPGRFFADVRMKAKLFSRGAPLAYLQQIQISHALTALACRNHDVKQGLGIINIDTG